MCPLLRGLPRRSQVNRRNTKKPPRTHAPLLAVIERLESRAMLAGLGQDSLSGLGSITTALLPGVSSPPGIGFNGGSPTLGSAAGTGGSQSNGPVLQSGSGSGTGSSTSGSGSSAPNGPVLQSGSGSGTSSSTSGSSSSAPNGPVLLGGTGSGTGSSSSGGGSSTPNGPVLQSGSGSGTDSTTSTAGGSPDPNSPVLLSQYTGGSNAGTQGSGTATGGTLSGSVLWLLYGAGLGAGSSSSGASGGSSSNLLTLLSQYNGGSNVGGQGNGTGGTLTNADLWGMYWSSAGAGSSSSSSDEGSLTNDPTILAQYTGGSGIGRITPLVYQFGSDDGPGFVSGVWNSDDGALQFVPVADTGTGQTDEGTSAGTQTWDGPVAPLGDRTYLVWDDSFGWQIVTDPPPKASPKNGDKTEGEQRDLSAGSTGTVTGGLIEEKLPIARAETEKFLTDTARDLAIALAFAGIGRIATARASQYVPTSVDPNKFKYIFGEVTSNPHNQARSLQNAAQMNRIGIQNTAEGWKYLTQHLQQIAQDSANVVRTIRKTLPDGSTVTLEIRESLLSGPGGFMKLESTWEILADGTRRLSTVMPFGG